MLYRLLSAMRHGEFQHIVVSLLDRGSLGSSIEALGVPLFTLKMKSLSVLASGLRLRRLVRRVQPDLIQGWMYHGNLAAVAARRLSRQNIPVIWNIRQSLYDIRDEKKTTAVAIRLGAKLSHLARKIIYNASISAEQHEALGYCAERRTIVGNGFDAQQFKPCPESRVQIRTELNLPISTPLIGLVARYHPLKDHATFLRAASLLVQSDRGVHFLLAGSNVDKDNAALTGLIEALGLQGHVHLLGERSDIPRLTAALDIATSASWAEGFPNVIGEAMACGVPCVVTEVGESPTLVGETGLVVGARNPGALAQAWQCLLKKGPEARRRLGMAARQRIIERYALDKIAAQYEALYASVSRIKRC